MNPLFKKLETPIYDFFKTNPDLLAYLQKEFTTHQEWLDKTSFPKASHQELANQTFRKIIEMMW